MPESRNLGVPDPGDPTHKEGGEEPFAGNWDRSVRACGKAKKLCC